MTTPQISIITPVFNTGAILMETVESVLNQQAYWDTPVPEFEMIIVDDHSQDLETLAILYKLPELDARIKVITNQHKKGVSGARNTGIDNAVGEWLAFLDSDDLLFQNSLAYKWNYIINTPNVSWLATPFYLLKPGIGIIEKPFSERSPLLYNVIRDDFNQGKPAILNRPIQILSKNCILGTLTVLVKKQLIVTLDGFNENLKRAEDYELWFKLAIQENLHYLTADTGAYRLRPDSLTRTDEPIFFWEDVMIKGLIVNPLFEPYLELLKARLHFVLLDYCYYYRRQGAYFSAVKWALQFVKEFPFSIKSWTMLIASIVGK